MYMYYGAAGDRVSRTFSWAWPQLHVIRVRMSQAGSSFALSKTYLGEITHCVKTFSSYGGFVSSFIY